MVVEVKYVVRREHVYVQVALLRMSVSCGNRNILAAQIVALGRESKLLKCIFVFFFNITQHSI